MVRRLLLLTLVAAASAAALRVEKTGRVGRKIETDYLVADLSQRAGAPGYKDLGTANGRYCSRHMISGRETPRQIRFCCQMT
jgi:hypothetical protein